MKRDVKLKVAAFFVLVVSQLSAAYCAAAESIHLKVSSGYPLVLAGRPQRVPIQITLEGAGRKGDSPRTPVNIAIVLDRSGSMSGHKMERAKAAAEQAVNLLHDDDIVSVIAYDHAVDVVVPATKASEREAIVKGIRSLYARGSTALFAGVSKGASEVRKFFDRNRVNRIILLSDGLANIGPSSPAELGSLGSSLGRDGISVTTLGLGLDYNEDLMVQLARTSDGNYAFIENSQDLERIFAFEFGDILSVVAQQVKIEIVCPDGVKPLRVFGREAAIHGRRVVTQLNQIYGAQDKSIVLEVEVPSGSAGAVRDVAEIHVAYSDMGSGSSRKVSDTVKLSFVDSPEMVERGVNREALSAYHIQLANAESMKAVALRDAGKLEDAEKVFISNVTVLDAARRRYNLPQLDSEMAFQERQAEDIKDADKWIIQRKSVGKEYDSKGRGQKW